MDPWLDGEPLHIWFPRLFAIFYDPAVLVSVGALDEGWNIVFRHSFGPTEVQEWADLREVAPLPLSQDPDTVSWSPSPLGEFSVSTAYQALLPAAGSPVVIPIVEGADAPEDQDFRVAASQRSFTCGDRGAETPWSGQWPLPPLPRPGNGNAHFVLVCSSIGTLVLCS